MGRSAVGRFLVVLAGVAVAGCGTARGIDGADGPGAMVTVEPPGANCPHGGVKVEAGQNAPAYVCNGADGSPGADGEPGRDGEGVVITVEPPSTNCPDGGWKVQAGTGDPAYICHGADGDKVVVTVESPGLACEAGGWKITAGALEPVFVCNGTQGNIGEPGADSPCAGNRPPVITSFTLPAPPLHENTDRTLTVHATDPDGDDLDYAVAGAGATLSGGQEGVFQFVPRMPGGPFVFSVVVSDRCSVTVGTFTIDTVIEGWQKIGSVGVEPHLRSHAVALLDGVPWVTYGEHTRFSTVRRIDGADWIETGLTLTPAEFPSMAIHRDTLYWSGSGGRVMKYGDDGWTDVADYDSLVTSTRPHLASDGNDLYIGYLYREGDQNVYNFRIGVKRLDEDSGSWEPVGYLGPEGLGVFAFGGYLDFEFFLDSGTPHVLFTPEVDADGSDMKDRNFAVMRYGDGAWEMVGQPGVAKTLYGNCMVVHQGVVYVALRYGSLWRHAGEAWEQVPGIALGENPRMVVQGGKLYVLASGDDQNLRLLELRGDEWVPVDPVSTTLDSESASMAADDSGFYVIHSSGGVFGRLAAMKLRMR